MGQRVTLDEMGGAHDVEDRLVVEALLHKVHVTLIHQAFDGLFQRGLQRKRVILKKAAELLDVIEGGAQIFFRAHPADRDGQLDGRVRVRVRVRPRFHPRAQSAGDATPLMQLVAQRCVAQRESHAHPVAVSVVPIIRVVVIVIVIVIIIVFDTVFVVIPMERTVLKDGSTGDTGEDEHHEWCRLGHGCVRPFYSRL